MVSKPSSNDNEIENVLAFCNIVCHIMVLMHMTCMLQVASKKHKPWSFSMLCNDFEGIALCMGVSTHRTAPLNIHKPKLLTVQDATAPQLPICCMQSRTGTQAHRPC